MAEVHDLHLVKVNRTPMIDPDIVQITISMMTETATPTPETSIIGQGHIKVSCV